MNCTTKKIYNIPKHIPTLFLLHFSSGEGQAAGEDRVCCRGFVFLPPLIKGGQGDFIEEVKQRLNT